MLILGIETSCDETAAAVVEDGTNVLSNVIATSQHAFEQSGGVIPEQAARKQVECIYPVLEQAFKDAHVSPKSIDAIAVTKGPGLLGSLLVGTTTARVLASVWKKPLIGVHHNFGHLSSIWLSKKLHHPFPILTLSVSGGHTELWYRIAQTKGKLLGSTRDDAAGEAFDKGAALLGLPYPGGPSIANAALGGNPHAFKFPLPLKGENNLDFSFSGLKTALKYLLYDLEKPMKKKKPRPPKIVSLDSLGPSALADIAASYQHALCRHLTNRIERALEQLPKTREMHIVGGVSANTALRAMLQQNIPPVAIRWPSAIVYCTDNAAMIAAAAYFLIEERGKKALEKFETSASLPLRLTP